MILKRKKYIDTCLLMCDLLCPAWSGSKLKWLESRLSLSLIPLQKEASGNSNFCEEFKIMPIT